MNRLQILVVATAASWCVAYLAGQGVVTLYTWVVQ